MIRFLLSATALGALSFATACSQSTDAPDTQLERADIEKIVYEYLIENPEVIEEAIIELQRRRDQAEAEEQQAKIDRARPVIEANAEVLTSNPQDYSIGPADAPVTVVEFFDYKCGPCRRSMGWVTTLPERYDGKVRVVFKEYPILTPQSRDASLATYAAGAQGKYIEMHQALMRDSSNFTQDDLERIATRIGLDIDQFRIDIQRAEFQAHLDENYALASQIGADATPSFVVGNNLSQGLNPVLLEAQISELLSKAG